MFIYIFFHHFFLLHTHILYFSLSSLLTFLYTFLLHQNTPEDQASRICPLSFQNIPFIFSLFLLSSTHLATQPTPIPTHFFILIFMILIKNQDAIHFGSTHCSRWNLVLELRIADSVIYLLKHSGQFGKKMKKIGPNRSREDGVSEL